MPANIEKFVIEVGFVSDKAMKDMKSFFKVLDSGYTKQSKQITSQNQLLSAQNTLRRKILQAEKEGLDTTRFRKSLNAAKKVETVKARTLELDKLILGYKDKAIKKNDDVAKKQIATEEARAKRIQKLEREMQDAVSKERLADLKSRMAKENSLKNLQMKKDLARQKIVGSKAFKDIERLSPTKAKGLKGRVDLVIDKSDVVELQKLKQEVTATAANLNKLHTAAQRVEQLKVSPKYTEEFRKARKSAQELEKAIDRAITRGDADEVERLRRKLQLLANDYHKSAQAARKASFAQQGLNDSTRNLVRSYVSIFALEGTQAINKTGQDFESLKASMLAATGTSQEAAAEMAFLDKMTSRLGQSLLDSADSYTKFLFASKGKLTTEETRELFTGVSEFATILGLSKERLKLSFTAIQQMMNKGTVTSEELKRQLAESLPEPYKSSLRL